MRVEAGRPAGDRVRDVRVQDQPLDLDRTYTLAVPDFLLLGGDGYKMLLGQRVLVGPESGTLMSVALEKYIAARKEIAPTVEGRIVIAKSPL